MTTVLRQTAEDVFAEELDALVKKDDRERPPNWRLSPQAVVAPLNPTSPRELSSSTRTVRSPESSPTFVPL